MHYPSSPLLLLLALLLLVPASFTAVQAHDDHHPWSFLPKKKALRSSSSDTNTDTTTRHLSDKLGYCETGCHSNSDCADSRVCYKRKSGDRVPDCCSGSTSNSKNYCVGRGCAAYTDDDRVDDDYGFYDLDDRFFNSLKRCEGDCDSDHDCNHGLICWKRKSGDPIPKCCEGTEGLKTSSSKDICASPICDELEAPASNSGGGGGGLCFSADTTVHLQGGTSIPMRDLQVGDRIRTASGHYQPVYAFAHRDELRYAKFLQIHSNHNNKITSSSLLEMSPEHLIYVQGKSKPIRVDALGVGTVLLKETQTVVTQIRPVIRQGLYAPLTADGTLVVADGIIASNYIAVQQQSIDDKESYVHIGNLSIPGLHQADVAHLWMSPLRLLCSANQNNTMEFCHSFTSDGMLAYASWGIRLVRYMEQQPLWAQTVVLLLGLWILSLCWIVEQVVMVLGQRAGWMHIISMFVAMAAMLARRRRTKNLQGRPMR